jgi:hypothetical protein
VVDVGVDRKRRRTEMAKEISEETKNLLKQVVDHFDDEDRSVRDRQIRTWRRLKLLWENIQHTYYSEVAHDWRIPELQRVGEDTDQGYYDKPVNVYRAYLESIIAALSVTVPPVVCYPDDADNPLDVTTAKAGNKIAELVFKHNDMPLFWLHALFVFSTEGMTACYAYPKDTVHIRKRNMNPILRCMSRKFVHSVMQKCQTEPLQNSRKTSSCQEMRM